MYKPGSVTCKQAVCHLSSFPVTREILRPTPLHEFKELPYEQQGAKAKRYTWPYNP